MVVGDLATTVDVLVLGAGAGGWAAAIRAAQLGKQVALVDPNPPGLSLAQHQAWHATLLAIPQQPQPGPDWSQLHSQQQGLIERYLNQFKQQLDQAQVELVGGKAWFLAANEVRIESEYGAKRYLFEHAVIAVGAEPTAWPGLPFADRRVITPRQALALPQLPQRLTILGSDYIAAELATLLAKGGVTVQLLLPAGQHLLPEFDASAGKAVQTGLEQLGVHIAADQSSAPFGESSERGLFVVSHGLTLRTTDLHLAQAGVAVDSHGFIQVNDRQQSSNPVIYAVGDVTGAPALIHVAQKQGFVAAETIAGRIAQFAPQAIPRLTRTDPAVAAVGLTAAEAEAAGYRLLRARGQAPGRIQAMEGFIHLVAEQDSDVILGVTVVGPHAAALIGIVALALEMGATLTDLAETLQPIGSAGEALAKAAAALLN